MLKFAIKTPAHKDAYSKYSRFAYPSQKRPSVLTGAAPRDSCSSRLSCRGHGVLRQVPWDRLLHKYVKGRHTRSKRNLFGWPGERLFYHNVWMLRKLMRTFFDVYFSSCRNTSSYCIPCSCTVSAYPLGEDPFYRSLSPQPRTSFLQAAEEE